MQPTVLVLTFNDGLDPASAENMANYKIVDPSGRPVAVESVNFDAALNTVTIRPRTRINLHHTYELTVIGTGANGVRDTEGRLLDGANTGVPGSDYVGRLAWRNLMWTPAEYKKYVHPHHVKSAGPATTRSSEWRGLSRIHSSLSPSAAPVSSRLLSARARERAGSRFEFSEKRA
jgi:hypothetical protein